MHHNFTSSSLAAEHKSQFSGPVSDHTGKLRAWSELFRKTVSERRELVSKHAPGTDCSILDNGALSTDTADIMVENVIGTLGLPLGIAPNFVINDKHYVVPMCVEEPSVIAACSSVSKLIAKCGGFRTTSTANIMTGQVQILDIENLEAAVSTIEQKSEELIGIGNQFCLSMKKRGGGVVRVEPQIVAPRTDGRLSNQGGYILVLIHIDVCEAMGANVINTVCEGVSPYLESITGGRVGLKILTNLCSLRRSVSTFKIPTDQLSWKGVDGKTVARRVVEAYEFAVDNKQRATTNNKGIMNGVDAVALATGQDWRAIECAANAFACRDGYYNPLACYYLEHDDTLGEMLCGSMEIPISVGVRGGAIQTHPGYKWCHELLNNPDAQSLAGIMVSVGLAQNFAALRALAIEGIQRGHMALHARNIAVTAGAPHSLIQPAVSYMTSLKAVTKAAARRYLSSYKSFKDTFPSLSDSEVPATITVSLRDLRQDDLFAFTLAIPNLSNTLIHLLVGDSDEEQSSLTTNVLGSNPSSCFKSALALLEEVLLVTTKRVETNLERSCRMLPLIFGFVATQSLASDPEDTIALLEVFLQDKDCIGYVGGKQNPSIAPAILLSCWKTFCHLIDGHELEAPLRNEFQNMILSLQRLRDCQSMLSMPSKDETDDSSLNSAMETCANCLPFTLMLMSSEISTANSNPKKLEFIRSLGAYLQFRSFVRNTNFRLYDKEFPHHIEDVHIVRGFSDKENQLTNFTDINSAQLIEISESIEKFLKSGVHSSL